MTVRSRLATIAILQWPVLALSLFCFLFCNSVAQSATLAIDTRTLPGLNPKAPIIINLLRLTGRIEEGDAAKLRKILSRIKASTPSVPGSPLATIELSSEGGDFYEGLNIGYLFREFDIATVVRKGDICLSACALAFLGGTASHGPPTAVVHRSIEIGGQVGFHNFFPNPRNAKLSATRDATSGIIVGFNLATGGSSLLVGFAAMMSIDPLFVARLLGRPAEEWDYIDTGGRFVMLATCPLGSSLPSVAVRTAATNICNHATGPFAQADPTQARRISAGETQRYFLEMVQRNVTSFDLKGPLARQLDAVINSRDSSLIDAVYSDLRLAGVPLPELMGPTFAVSGYGADGSQFQCHVSLSLDNPNKYDVAIEGPGGMSRAFRTAPTNCRMLFRYDRDEILNPRK